MSIKRKYFNFKSLLSLVLIIFPLSFLLVIFASNICINTTNFVMYSRANYNYILISNEKLNDNGYIYMHLEYNSYYNNSKLPVDILMEEETTNNNLFFDKNMSKLSHNGCKISANVANEYNIKVGDVISLSEKYYYKVEYIIDSVLGIDHYYNNDGVLILSNTNLEEEKSLKYLYFSNDLTSMNTYSKLDRNVVKNEFLIKIIIDFLILSIFMIIDILIIEFLLLKDFHNDYYLYKSNGESSKKLFIRKNIDLFCKYGIISILLVVIYSLINLSYYNLFSILITICIFVVPVCITNVLCSLKIKER